MAELHPPSSTVHETNTQPGLLGRSLNAAIGTGVLAAPLLALSLWGLAGAQQAAVAFGLALVATLFNTPHLAWTFALADKGTRAKLAQSLVGVGTVVLVVAHLFPQSAAALYTLFLVVLPLHMAQQSADALGVLNQSPTSKQARLAMGLWSGIWIAGAMVGPASGVVLHQGYSQTIAIGCQMVLLVFGLALAWGVLRTQAKPLRKATAMVLGGHLALMVLPALVDRFMDTHQAAFMFAGGAVLCMHALQALWLASQLHPPETLSLLGRAGRLKALVLLVAGGLVLTVVAPFLISRLVHFDAARSVLLFDAVVGLTHMALQHVALKDLRTSADGRTWRSGPNARAPAPQKPLGVAAQLLFGGTAVLVFAVYALTLFQDHLVRLDAPPPDVEMAGLLNPGDCRVPLQKASKAATEDMQRALEILQTGLKHCAYDPQMRLTQARTLVLLGQHKKALAQYRQIPPRLWEPAADQLARGTALVAAGQLAQADAALNIANQAGADPLLIARERYEIAVQRKDQEATKTQARLVLDAMSKRFGQDVLGMKGAPKDAGILALELAKALLNPAKGKATQDDASEALGTLTRVVQGAARNDAPAQAARALYWAGQASEGLAQYPEALSFYQRSLRVGQAAPNALLEGQTWLAYAQLLDRSQAQPEAVYQAVLLAQRALVGMDQRSDAVGPLSVKAGMTRLRLQSVLGAKARPLQLAVSVDTEAVREVLLSLRYP